MEHWITLTGTLIGRIRGRGLPPESIPFMVAIAYYQFAVNDRSQHPLIVALFSFAVCWAVKLTGLPYSGAGLVSLVLTFVAWVGYRVWTSVREADRNKLKK